MRQRPAARRDRPQLAGRRPRSAPGARPVRGDALPLRRRRRPRLAAELRARAARESLPGGVYGLLLEAGDVEDVVAFAVRRGAGAEPAANVVVLPTFTYLAYSCEREGPAAAGSERPEDRWGAEAGLRSLYDRHADGVGVYEASLLRPLTQLRPGYRCSQHGGPHGLAQDLILIDWLARKGISFDVVTDHDLHREGAAALAGHRTVITGLTPSTRARPCSTRSTATSGPAGSLAYLGGNGLNGSVSVDPRART